MSSTNPYTDFSKMFEPVQKLVELNISKFDQAVANQTVASKTFIEQAEAQIKSATEVQSYDALVAFMKEQTEIAKNNMEQMIADSKTATEEVVAYSQEVQKILSESVDMAKPAASTKKSAGKKVA